MNISKFFSMLIAGLAIIGLTSIGLATQEEGKQSEGKEAIKSEAIEEGESAAKVESEAESKEEIQCGADPKLKSVEKKLRKRKKNSFKIW